MAFITKRWADVIIFCILLIGSWLRAGWYGDLRLSVSNPETNSYIESSRAPLLSWKAFTGSRLFTTNLIFKVANDEKKCPVTAYSAPAAGKESARANQPCFDKIALLQNYLSIFGWCFLAWMLSRRLKSPFIRITAAIIIVLFGFTPQVAEWDSILSPESLSLSLFAIAFALLIELAFRVSASKMSFSAVPERLLFTIWMIVFLLWIFVRDVHLYAIVTSLGLIVILLLFKKFRETKYIAAAIVLLTSVFIVGFISAKQSFRATRYPVVNAVDFYILPYPQRAEFFKKFDMPERESPGYQEWADANASKAYGLFLISHPGFIITTLWENMPQFTSDFIQPYFMLDMKTRDSLLVVGEMVHPQTASVFVIDLLLMIALCAHAIKYRGASITAWMWLAAWFLSIAAITLFLSFFGDIYGTRRHIMPSVEMLRLFQWIFLMPFLDRSLTSTEKTS